MCAYSNYGRNILVVIRVGYRKTYFIQWLAVNNISGELEK